jgi:hypothetical protein
VKASLSGSLGLNWQEKKTRRDPKDIDIFLPFLEQLKIPKGMVRYENNSEDLYDDEFYERVSYVYKGVLVDIFSPCNEDVPNMAFDVIKGVNVLLFFEIMKMKIAHSYGDHWSRHKHRQDIQYMLSLQS